MLDFRLKVFKSVATNLSFTKASNELFITQPAVTKHIKELEAEFGIKLFDRIGNKIALTEAGRLVLLYAGQISTLHNDLLFELSRLRGTNEGNLRVGASTTIAQYVLPAALALFHEAYPGISLSLMNGNTEYIEKRLLNNEIDLGIVEGKPTNNDIRYSNFIDDELLVFTSSKNKAIPNLLTKDDFLKLPLILRERGSGTLAIIRKALQSADINPKDLKVQMHLGSTESIKSYIKAGNGIGIVSRYAIEHELQSGMFRLLSIEGLSFQRRFYFISPQGPELQGQAKLFVSFLQKQYNFSL